MGKLQYTYDDTTIYYHNNNNYNVYNNNNITVMKNDYCHYVDYIIIIYVYITRYLYNIIIVYAWQPVTTMVGTYLMEILLSRNNTTGCEDSRCIFDTKIQADHFRI